MRAISHDGYSQVFNYKRCFSLTYLMLRSLIIVGSHFGYELAKEYELYLENDSRPNTNGVYRV